MPLVSNGLAEGVVMIESDVVITVEDNSNEISLTQEQSTITIDQNSTEITVDNETGV